MGMVLMSSTPEGSSWTPVLQLKDDIYVGVNGENDVCVGTKVSPDSVVDENTPSELLVLLERSYSDIHASLLRADVELEKVLGYFESRIPLARIPYAALSRRSDYWVGLALDWIGDMQVNEFVDLLSSVQEARWVSQQVRHRARKLLKGSRM